MSGKGRLASGSRVAVLGGGVAGAAMAAALLANARARGVALDVRLYAGGRGERTAPPAVLTPECRSRLAALGCRVPLEWRTLELRGVEVVAGGVRETLPAPAGGLWVVDGWPDRAGGTDLVAEALRTAATAQGARLVERRAERVEHAPPPSDAPAPVRAAGPLVVRAYGAAERFHAVALAGGAGAHLGDAFFEGFSPAPSVAAVQGRLRVPGWRRDFAPVARVWLAPLPGVDALVLLPCTGGVYAQAWGAAIQPADFCQALMLAARDGLLEEGFELAALEVTRRPAGAGASLVAEGRLAVGPAAFGHPLQLGLSETLASCSRASVALLEAGTTAQPLARRYLREGVGDLLEDAQQAVRALGWLKHAGSRAPEAFVRARARGRVTGLYGGGVLGLPSPTPSALLRCARWAGVREWAATWLRAGVEPVPPVAPLIEPDLYYVVDDDAEQREALTELLESQGARVVAFADELALYCAVARRPPTAILLDVVLTWVDGLRLCEGLKRHPLTRDTRVFVMSGLNRPHVRARALDAGAEAFLPKPVDAERLMRVLTGRMVPPPTHVHTPAASAASSVEEPPGAFAG